MHRLPTAGPAAELLTGFVRGHTLELADARFAPIVGTTQIDPARSDGEHDLAGLPSSSVDAIVCQRLPWPMRDPLRSIGQWRRVLQPGGPLAVVLTSMISADPVAGLLTRVGGFNVDAVEELEGGGGFVLIATRSLIAEVRGPIGSVMPELADVVTREPEARAELYFELGTLLLQIGDAERALGCFEAMLELEPESSHARFGMGMCYANAGRWDEALVELEDALAREPGDPEFERWMELARTRAREAEQAATAPVSGDADRASASVEDAPSLTGSPATELVDSLTELTAQPAAGSSGDPAR